MSSSYTLARPAPQMDLATDTEPAAAPLRPKWYSVVRPHDLRLRPRAIAAADGRCGECGSEVLEHEPILAVGAYVVAHEDGTRTVDLSGVEWRCQRCTVVFQPGGVH